MTFMERLCAIDKLLLDGKAIPLQVFLNRIGVSRSTLKRDMEYMRNRLGLPIEWNASAGGYRCTLPNTQTTAPSAAPTKRRSSAKATERFLAISKLLGYGKVVPLQVFLKRLRVSASTFKRDLAYMRGRLNIRIEWDRVKGGYCYPKHTAWEGCSLPVHA